MTVGELCDRVHALLRERTHPITLKIEFLAGTELNAIGSRFIDRILSTLRNK